MGPTIAPARRRCQGLRTAGPQTVSGGVGGRSVAALCPDIFSRCPPERLERYMRTLLATAVGPGPQAAQDP